MAGTARQFEFSARQTRFWFALLFGAAILASLIIVVLHASEQPEFLRSLRQSQPEWILAALAFQGATYFAQGEIWRTVARGGKVRLPIGKACQLSLAKLFVDQALPSGGLSGAAVVARALEVDGLPRCVVMASLVIGLVSYYAAYIVCLIIALAIASMSGYFNVAIIATSFLFIIFAVVLTSVVFALLAGKGRAFLRRARRLRFIAELLEMLSQADPQLVKQPRLVAKATFWQILIVLLDAATMWVLVRALGTSVSALNVYSSFMISSLLRTVGFVPGGLGTFEAASVFTLKLAGVPVGIALSATLLFRGASFWLPMLPGLFFSRQALRSEKHAMQAPGADEFWALSPASACEQLQTTELGLSSDDAHRRLLLYGPNELRERDHFSRIALLWNQLRSPLLSLLVFAAGASVFTGEWADATVILLILTGSVGIGYSREFRATTAAAALRERVRTQAKVVRDGIVTSIPRRDVVLGDVLVLSAGSLIPADALVIEATDFYVNEGLLTGESFPVEKRPGVVASEATISERTNCVYLGTNVRNGTARCVVCRTGAATEFGGIAHRLTLRPPQTEFDRGLLRFGYLVTTSMLIMVLLVFAANVFLGRPPVETFLFSIALAVGMSPELLPAILSVNLARGAGLMARHGVLVRHLNAIENLGSMDVLCTDKTGTLTEGIVRLEGAYDAQGIPSEEVLKLSSLNAALQAGLTNPLDEAILKVHAPVLEQVVKIAEIPYDFTRKRLSVIIREDSIMRIITKGAFEQVLAVCTRSAEGKAIDSTIRASLLELFQRWSGQGTRVLAVAARELADATHFGREDERDLCFLGFLTFLDHPKDGANEAIRDLGRLGVSVKLITGDAELIARHVAVQVGLPADRVLTGRQLASMHDEALWSAAEETNLFVEVDPNQKERIIQALRKMGHVVGFLGDGINDAPAMHAADTSLSVDTAADVAKDAADFVLLDRNLDVIRRGIEEGRTTFANTLKYVLTTMSANLGNMLSMAVASIFLPFLPLLAGQILLNNFLSDIPAIGLAGDTVDPELINRPRRWNIRFIGRFMVEFGLLSSVFDFLTFGALIGLFAVGPETFRSAWFVESLLTELLIALVVRTQRPLFRSRPGTFLLVSTLLLIAIALTIPYLPYVQLLGFEPLSPAIVAAVLFITGMYVIVAEFAKAHLYRRAQA